MEQATATKVALTYSMSLAEMLRACEHVGKVDHLAAEMLSEENFLIQGEGKVAMPFLERIWSRSNNDIGSERAREILKERGLRPATLPELLMYMVNNPEEATTRALVALSPTVLTPIGGFKIWYGEQTLPYVPIIINRKRHHNGAQLVRAGEPEICLTCVYGSWSGYHSNTDWHFAVVPE